MPASSGTASGGEGAGGCGEGQQAAVGEGCAEWWSESVCATEYREAPAENGVREPRARKALGGED